MPLSPVRIRPYPCTNSTLYPNPSRDLSQTACPCTAMQRSQRSWEAKINLVGTTSGPGQVCAGLTTEIADQTHQGLSPNHSPRASIVPKECMGNRTLIFVPTGKEHSQVRQFMREVVFKNHGTVAKHASTKLHFDQSWGEPNSSSTDETVSRALAYNLWLRMFGSHLSAEDLETIRSYTTYGGVCVLGESAMKIIDPISKAFLDESVLKKVTPLGACQPAQLELQTRDHALWPLLACELHYIYLHYPCSGDSDSAQD